MKINTSEKFIAYLTLISGLTISGVAVWYSVAGLVSIFAAAAVPIIIMGVALELSKLVATVWLKINWQRAPTLIRTYLISAIAILMLITSMGIFGFLSKAHLDQNMVSGDVVDKVAIIDEKIKTQRDNIDAARKALVQMDAAVDQTMARSTSEQGADKAANLRRSQAKERANLQKDISTAQTAIAKLNEERAPMAKDLRAIEAEVGPIKYIAAFVYGSNPDANLLEKAVTWVIIIIVVVFDPLAVVLLLASQYSFQWFRKEREDAGLEIFAGNPDIETSKPTDEEEFFNKARDVARSIDGGYYVAPVYPPASNATSWTTTTYEPDDGALTDEQIKQINDMLAENAVVVEPELDTVEETVTNTYTPSVPMGTHYAVAQEEDELEDHEIIDAASTSEKEAMAAWKHDNPDSSLKLQRKLLDKGIIAKLPWLDYIKSKETVVTDNEAAAEALKWAQEQLDERPGDYIPEDESKKKDSGVDGDSRGTADQKDVDSGHRQELIPGYQQNAEQSERTIWQRIQDAKK